MSNKHERDAMSETKVTVLKRYVPYTHIGIFVLLFGYVGYFLIAAFFSSDTNAFSGNGRGVESDPYQISTCEQLQEIREDNLGKYYVLVNDIDCTDSVNWDNRFQSIPTFSASVLDGRNHKITNIWIDESQASYLGMFRQIENDAIVKNIRFDGGTIRNTYTGTGSTINFTGTVAGVTLGNARIENVSSSAMIYTNSSAGGIAGQHVGLIKASQFNGGINSSNTDPAELGGIVARIEGGIIRNSSATPNIYLSDTVTSNAHSCGGVVGKFWLVGGTLENSYSAGSVNCSSTTNGASGGMIGRMFNTSLINILNNVSQTNVTPGNGINNGGLIGEYQYSSEFNSIIQNSFYDPATNGINQCIGNYNDTQLCGEVNTNSYPGYFRARTDQPLNSWDFDTIWSEADNAPTLRPPLFSPEAPTLLTASNVNYETVNLSWTPPINTGGSPITSYTVAYRILGDDAWTIYSSEIPGDAEETPITNLESNTTYQFRVQANNELGYGLYSESTQQTTQLAPAATLDTPTNLVRSDVSSTSIQISWDAVDNASTYQLSYHGPEDEDWIYLDPSADTNATITNLSASTTYVFRVQAFGSDAEADFSELSAEFSTSTLAPGEIGISNCTELQDISNELSASYVLDQNINCADSINWNGGAGFEPIGGFNTEPFVGSFDGNGYTISNLYINKDTGIASLFESATDATLQNVTLQNPTIIVNGATGATAFLGQSINTNVSDVKVRSLTLNATDTSFTSGVLGLQQGGDITRISATGTINSAPTIVSSDMGNAGSTGGLVAALIAYEDTQAILSESYSNVSINVDFANEGTYTSYGIGGIAGSTHNSTINNTYSKGSITTSSSLEAVPANSVLVAGIVGMAQFDSSINFSYSTGTLTNNISTTGGSAPAAGLVGVLFPDTTLNHSFSTSTLQSKDNTFNGGAIGALLRVDGLSDPVYTGLFYKDGYDCIKFGFNISTNTPFTDYDTTPCIALNSTDITSLYNSRTTPPLHTWDFRDIWKVNANGLPTFIESTSNPTPASSVGVGTCEELQAIRENLDGTYHLKNNINCSDTENWNNGAGFVPIGEGDTPFTGTLDGKNHTISGLYIHFDETGPTENTSIRGVGLFAGVYEATLKNINLTNSSIASPQTFNNNTIMTGSIVGIAELNSDFDNINVTNTDVYSGAISGGLFGIILPYFSNDPIALLDALMPDPNTQTRVKLDSMHFEGSIDGIISGGIIGASTAGLNVSKNNTDSYTLLLKNSSADATIRTTTGGGLVGVSYSLGSDPISFLFYSSLANGNLIDFVQLLGELDPELNPCENPAAIPDLVLEQFEFYCALAAEQEGYDLSVIGTRIENSHSTGEITTCNNVTGFSLGALGGIVGAAAGMEIRGSYSDMDVSTCSGNFSGTLPLPPFSMGLLGGIASGLINSRVNDTYYSGNITSNKDNENAPYIGVSGGISAITFSLGDFDKKPILKNSYSTGTIDHDEGNFTVSMSGGLTGLLIGAGTITDSHSNMAIKNVLTQEIPNFLEEATIQEAIGTALQTPSTNIGLTFSGGLVGSTWGINVPAIINNGANLYEATFEEAGAEFNRDYDLGNSRGLTITDSYANGSTTGTFSGGLLGSADMSTNIQKSYSEGEAKGFIAGGFIGATGVPGGALSVVNRTFLNEETGACEGINTDFRIPGAFITSALLCSSAAYDSLNSAQKDVIGDADSIFKQLSVTDSYTKTNVIGTPLEVNVQFDLTPYDAETRPFLPPSIKGVVFPTVIGGISGLYAPSGGSIKNTYAAGTLTTTPISYNEVQTESNIVRPFKDISGGMFGINLALPNISLGQDVKNGTPTYVRNSFAAGTKQLASPTWDGAYSGLIINPLGITDLVFGETETRSKTSVSDGIYYDKSKLAVDTCTGISNAKQAVKDIGRVVNPVLDEIPVDEIPDEYANRAIGEANCKGADTVTNPKYFIGNTANEPLNSWNFDSIWKTRLNDYPDFIGDVINGPGSVPGGTTNTTNPGRTTRNTWPVSVPVFGFSATSESTAIEIGKLPKIGSSPFLISGLTAKLLQALPWLLLLLLSLLYLQQAWSQNQVNKRFRSAILLSQRVKETISGFITISSHYLVTPTATISSALELLVSLKAIKGDRAVSLTNSAKELTAYVNDLTARSQKAANTTDKSLTLPNKHITPASMRKWVTIPIVIAIVILIISLTVLDQIEVLEVTSAALLLNVALLAFAAILVYVTYKIRVNQSAANLALDRALSAEKAVVEQRKDIILEAETRFSAFVHELALNNKTLEKSKNAKPYMSGLADLQKITDSFHKVYKFATTNMPYASEVSPAILEALAPIRLEAKTRHIDLVTDVPPEITTVLSLDEAHHIIYSLMDNALKFSAEGSKVRLTIVSDASQTYIQVVDHGIGIPKDKLDGLMQPFARATDAKKYNYEGMGLDLFITRILVEKYGGSIDIASKVDEGTTVTIVIKK